VSQFSQSSPNRLAPEPTELKGFSEYIRIEFNSIKGLFLGLRAWARQKSQLRQRRRQTESKLVKRLDIAQNIYSDIEVLRVLAQDKSAQVRQLVASNPSITKDIIKKLVEDKNQIVRFNIAQRFDLSKEDIDILVQDKAENVLTALALREKLTHDQELALLKGGTGVRQKLALRKNLHRAVSQLLAEDPDQRVRILLAAMTPHMEILEILEKEDNFEIKQVIAKRKGNFNPKDPQWDRRNRGKANSSMGRSDSWIRSLTSEIFKREGSTE
jgi:hypothetical protein